MQYRIETVKSFNQTLRWKDGLMNDAFFFVLFNSISLLSGRRVDNESVCAMGSHI